MENHGAKIRRRRVKKLKTKPGAGKLKLFRGFIWKPPILAGIAMLSTIMALSIWSRANSSPDLPSWNSFRTTATKVSPEAAGAPQTALPTNPSIASNVAADQAFDDYQAGVHSLARGQTDEISRTFLQLLTTTEFLYTHGRLRPGLNSETLKFKVNKKFRVNKKISGWYNIGNEKEERWILSIYICNGPKLPDCPKLPDFVNYLPQSRVIKGFTPDKFDANALVDLRKLESKSNGLQVRARPDISQEPIQNVLLPNGAPIQIIDIYHDEWLEVIYPYENGEYGVGWIPLGLTCSVDFPGSCTSQRYVARTRYNVINASP